mmetsp:Transcript_21862/g.30168  ORF Transcript_21862/g.30168 Transcript_21862/m.30168 type:complete len:92 (-) Transcript_21862:104-379(-)
MDLNMPIVDGYEACIRILEMQMKSEEYGIKGLPLNEELIPIIAVTAFVTQETIDYALQVGMREVLYKPVKFDYLQEVLDKYYYKSVQADQE